MGTKSERTAGMVAKVTCIARKTDGRPCSNRPMKGQNICKNHGGAAPQARRRAAERILLAQDIAAAKLIELMNNPDVPYSVQRMAAADLLDRGGNVAAHVLAIPGLNTDTQPWQQVFEQLVGGSRAESRARRGIPTDQSALAQSASDPGEIVDAEVVEEPPACSGCERPFPAELPEWLDAYPEFCRDCRAERGLPDPPRRVPTRAEHVGHPSETPGSGMERPDRGTGNLQPPQRLTNDARRRADPAGEMLTMSDAVRMAAEANRKASGNYHPPVPAPTEQQALIWGE